MQGLPRWMVKLDWFLISIIFTITIASFFPARGDAAPFMENVANGGIFLLFFLYGARLSTKDAFAAMRDWRLHGVILGITYIVFPLLGLTALLIPAHILAPQLATGLLFLTVLPSTVQSSIAFTSLARGNVAAAICAASFSNVLGVFLTPLLVALLLHADVGVTPGALLNIFVLLLAPFILGQLLQRYVGPWVKRHPTYTKMVDRGVILLVVYNAFSHGVVGGIWTQTPIAQLIVVVIACALILALALVLSHLISKAFGFSRADQIVVLFCGSKKSLASGLPMANVLLPAASVSLVILPLIVFHQIQLMVCAVIARRIAASPDTDAVGRVP